MGLHPPSWAVHTSRYISGLPIPLTYLAYTVNWHSFPFFCKIIVLDHHCLHFTSIGTIFAPFKSLPTVIICDRHAVSESRTSSVAGDFQYSVSNIQDSVVSAKARKISYWLPSSTNSIYFCTALNGMAFQSDIEWTWIASQCSLGTRLECGTVIARRSCQYVSADLIYGLTLICIGTFSSLQFRGLQ